MENKVIYVPVSVQEELPPIGEEVWGLAANDMCTFERQEDDTFLLIGDHRCYKITPQIWLKKIELPSEEEIKEKAESNFPINDKMSWEVREYVEWQRLQLQAGAKYILSIINQKK